MPLAVIESGHAKIMNAAADQFSVQRDKYSPPRMNEGPAVGA